MFVVSQKPKMKLQAQDSTTLEPADLSMEILRITVKVPMIICEEVAPPQDRDEEEENVEIEMSPPSSPRTMCLLAVPTVDSSIERRPCEFNNNTVQA